MYRRMIGWVILLAALCVVCPIVAQDIDSIITSESRKPATIADEIRDPAERAAYLALFKKNTAETTLALAKDFLQRYPQSSFLFLVYEVAARSSFDLGDLKAGLDYAHQSLALLPENPLFLVAVADVQAREHENDAAIASARDSLEYLDRFARPVAIAASGWPEIQRKQEAIAHFVIGRALIQKALEQPNGEGRSTLLDEAATSLSLALALNPTDTEASYLLGEDYLFAKNPTHAAAEFAFVYRKSTEFAPLARKQLQLIYNVDKHSSASSFETFVADAARLRTTLAPPASAAASNTPLPKQGYAGSAACESCHGGVYGQWKQSGMAKMLRPYQPQNIIGDFQKNNEFYAGDDVEFRRGKFVVTPNPKRVLFASMVIRNGSHYFDIKQSDGRWHSYPVDYTIGSKWQQAYATILPDKKIQVFPIQYSTIQKSWVNYWKVIDSADTTRSNPYNWEKFGDDSNYQLNCAVCHTSQLHSVKAGVHQSQNLVFREPGIDCEMCHGPSGAHIDAIASGKAYRKGPLDPPVQFNRLNGRDFVSICAQCHMQSNVHATSSDGELNYSTAGTFFLRNASVPFGEFSRKGFFKDGRFSQSTFIVEALERSKCFRKGDVTCGTCHDPHSHTGPSNKTSLKYPDDPDRMCVGCHTRLADKVAAAAHTHHPVESEASRCVSCHMPRIMDGLLFRARSHQIDDVPNAENTIRFGQDDSPNACMLCHTDKTAEWVQLQRKTWKPGTLVNAKIDAARPMPAIGSQ